MGSVTKFYKKNAALRWHAQLDTLTSVDAIAERTSSTRGHFYGCGKNSTADRGTAEAEQSFAAQAWFFSMDRDGEVEWMLRLGGTSLR